MRVEKHNILNDHLKRKYYLKYEIVRLLIKSTAKNQYFSNVLGYSIYLKLTKYHRYSLNAKTINKCITSGRAHGVLRYFKFSRFLLRKESLKLKLSGVRRKSW